MLPPPCLINTQIIYVKGPDVSQYVVVLMLLKNTERISQYTFRLIGTHKDWPVVIMNQCTKLFVRVFFCFLLNLDSRS